MDFMQGGSKDYKDWVATPMAVLVVVFNVLSKETNFPKPQTLVRILE